MRLPLANDIVVTNVREGRSSAMERHRVTGVGISRWNVFMRRIVAAMAFGNQSELPVRDVWVIG